MEVCGGQTHAGAILTGARLPTDCVAYEVRCTPVPRWAPPMVSAEGHLRSLHSAGRTRRSPA
ncbi:hypothetical protein ACIQ9Q_05625 [Streptomyces sp. NPDC094438]|uniref:hypothetical protein n=1 Tax=Streptomyces sp. NPDC094438 TaxID=3366061 RepID=UPI0037F4FDC8